MIKFPIQRVTTAGIEALSAPGVTIEKYYILVEIPETAFEAYLSSQDLKKEELQLVQIGPLVTLLVHALLPEALLKGRYDAARHTVSLFPVLGKEGFPITEIDFDKPQHVMSDGIKVWLFRQ